MFVTKKMEEGYNDEWDVMISYEWKTGLKYAGKLFTELTKIDYKVWLDRNEMMGNIYDKMANAVLKSKVIILLISEAYEKSENCKLEYNYIIKERKLFVPAKVENYNPVRGRALDLIIAGELYYSLYKDFDSEVKLVLMAIADKLKKPVNKTPTNLMAIADKLKKPGNKTPSNLGKNFRIYILLGLFRFLDAGEGKVG